MPGSILVSVLEAVDLPAAAEEGEFVSVKVSVGKMEFQTSASKTDSGKTVPWNSDFSFPVLNLRDNLVVTVIGSKGEEISQNEVDTPSIVEKGFCDEFLSLKGGGSVHLVVSFVLTEEERQRIEMMRAAASRKNEPELVRMTSNNQLPQLIEELRTSSTGLMPTMAVSTTKETSRADTEHILGGVAGKSVEGTESKGEETANADPMAIEEITESPVSLPDTSDSTNLTPNSVKARVKAFERSFSQDVSSLSQSIPSQSGNLQGQKSTELVKYDAVINMEEKKKSSKTETESLISETSRKLSADDNLHLKEGKAGKDGKAGWRVSSTDVAQQHLMPGVPSPCSNKVENTDDDLLYKASTVVREGENKNVNSTGILDFAKQALSGALMVTVAVLIWATAANSSRRRTSITQNRQRKK